MACVNLACIDEVDCFGRFPNGDPGQVVGLDGGGALTWITPTGLGTDDQIASEVPFTPYQTLLSTDVQAVIEELFDLLFPYRMVFTMGGDSHAVTAAETLTYHAVDDIATTELRASLSTAGSTDTIVDFKVNTGTVGTVTIPSGLTLATAAMVVSIVDGDELVTEVNTAGTGAFGLIATVVGKTA